MFEWKVEEMKLMSGNKITVRRNVIYSCENTTSREDKISFVDSMQDGKLSYILALIGKYDADKENLKKDEYGNVKSVSLKAWLRRNDKGYSHGMVDDYYYYGQYNILGSERYITYGTGHKGLYDCYDDLVDECFHRQLVRCEEQEKKYFAEHDEQSILEKQVKEKLDRYRTDFGVRIVIASGALKIGDSETDSTRKMTIEELKELLSKYAQLDALVEKLTAETNIKY